MPKQSRSSLIVTGSLAMGFAVGWLCHRYHQGKLKARKQEVRVSGEQKETSDQPNGTTALTISPPTPEVHSLASITLAQTNPHSRDVRVCFEEKDHIYTIDGGVDGTYTSVTTYLHSLQGFPGRYDHSNSPKWPASQYYPMTAEEIKAAWERNRDEAAALGTALHKDIELYYNGMPTQENHTVEYRYFLEFAADHAHLKPYRTEWCIFDEATKLAGCVDMVFELPNGTLAMYDWKRSKEIVKKKLGSKQVSTTPELATVPDSNFWHYSLQQNTYKTILERRYGVTVSEMWLVILHPNNKSGTYEKLEVPDMSAEMTALWGRREREVRAEGEASV